MIIRGWPAGVTCAGQKQYLKGHIAFFSHSASRSTHQKLAHIFVEIHTASSRNQMKNKFFSPTNLGFYLVWALSVGFLSVVAEKDTPRHASRDTHGSKSQREKLISPGESKDFAPRFKILLAAFGHATAERSCLPKETRE